ncbi:MAG: efflux RND transporter periplasmic adaptor subunit [Thiogranum sp.]|nr:efflux RND transporter periplasmic adaptor subunit [Thiogranum sp.]
MNNRTATLLALVLGAAALAPHSPAGAAEDKGEILYWVAPMDPNYRRDQPGKSPMGMDLVPVYADAAGEDSGTVSIDPAVVENLGVRTATVERGPLWRRIDTVGYVAFDERRISHIHLRTDGWIEKLSVKSNGERVKQGDLLFELYSPDLVNAQEEYVQALRGNNDYLQQASRERLEALGVSAGQIRQIKKTRRASQRVKVYASQDGIVDSLNVREGMYVKPATEVMALADLSSVWLLVDIFERQSDWVAPGQPAEVRLGYLPGRVWEGEVEFVYPTIDPKTRTLQARLRFDNPDEALKPNMYATVNIYAGPKRDVLSIPREALIKTGSAQRVIVALDGGKFKPRKVTSGMESGDFVEVTGGLSEGDRVVTSAQFLIDSEASLKASFTRMDDAGEASHANQPGADKR